MRFLTWTYGIRDAWLIEKTQMRESRFFQEILQEGRVEGQLKRARADVLQAIELRFSAEAAAEFQEALGSITDPEQLSQLFRLAVKGRRLAELRRGFASARAAR